MKISRLRFYAAVAGRLAIVVMTLATAAQGRARAESPFACTPSAMSPAERTKHFGESASRLRALNKGVRELPDGYEFAFPSDPSTYRLLSEWMLEERLCCPFFDLSLRLDREGGPLWFRLTGRKGVKEFVASEFQPWVRGANKRS